MDNQDEIVAFLSEGTSYGNSDLKVDRIETHISIVFLVGDRAFKLKRAVRNSYLDFSTVEMRRKSCKAELELNRRTAPSLYVGVNAITREPAGQLAFSGKGTIVDWVVEMRRFSQMDLFDNLAESGELTPHLMRDLADVVARFHATAEAVFDQGGSEGMKKTIAGNNVNLVQSCPPLVASRVQQLFVTSMAKLSMMEDLLDKRQAFGMVRRCHGDLHLRNVCLFEGRPTPFDCIEFNEEISRIDVLYDLAFLLMDLIYKDLGSLANTVFNRYLDMTDDLDGLPALPLFMSARAAIRAHVAVSTGKIKNSDFAAKSAQSYLSIAETLLHQHPPCLIAIGGFSGVGKSTIAQAAAPYFQPAPGARVIRSDVLRKRLFEVEPEKRLPPHAYEKEVTGRVYDAMYDQAIKSLHSGYTAIVDAAFLQQDERVRIATAAEASRVPFVGFWLQAPSQVLDARLSARRGDASDADTLVLQQQLKSDLGTINWHRIDATRVVDIPSFMTTIQSYFDPPALNPAASN